MTPPSWPCNELGLALGLAKMAEEMRSTLLPSHSGTSTLPGSTLLLLLLQRCMLVVVGRLPCRAMLKALGLTILGLPVMLTELGLTILGLAPLGLRDPLMDLTCEQTHPLLRTHVEDHPLHLSMS